MKSSFASRWSSMIIVPDDFSALLSSDLRPLRTLEVYCGRAGWSANMKMRGDHAWFLDHDESKVSPSFATKEDELCINGLDEVLHMSVATIQRDPRLALRSKVPMHTHEGACWTSNPLSAQFHPP
jgi:hypothetical protein